MTRRGPGRDRGAPQDPRHEDQGNGTPDARFVIGRSTTPGVATVVDRAVELTNKADRRWGCRHVVQNGTTPVFIDVQQPQLGVRCHRCAVADISRHDPAEELTCDECRRPYNLLHGGYVFARAEGLRVSDTAGYHRVLNTVVTLFGFGLCRDCVKASAA